MSMICELIEVDEAQINEFLANPESVSDFLEENDGGIDLDKAWHGLHFLLTGSAWDGEEPLCFLVKGGEEIGDEDAGYGPARVLKPNQVGAWADSLSAISNDELSRRFNPEAMIKAEIYPSIWNYPEEEDEPLGYLLEYYEILCSFLEQAKSNHNGVMISLT